MARQIFATYTDSNGESREFSVEEMRSALGDRPGLLSELVKESYTLESNREAGFAVIDLHPEGLFSRLHDQLVAVPLIGFPGVALKPGRYYALYDVVHDNDKTLTGIDPRESNGIFLVADKEQLEGDYDALMVVTLHAEYEEGNDPDKAEMFAFAIGKDQQNLATVHDFIESLTTLAALCLTMEGTAEPGPQIVKTGRLFTDAMRGKPNRKNDFWETGEEYLAELGTLKITAESEKALETALASSKTLIQLNALATASDYKYEKDRTLTVQTTLDELLEGRGVDVANLAKTTRSKKRAKVKEELLSLAGTAWSYTDENGDFVRVPLAGGACSVVRGNVSFVFSSAFMGAVLNRGAGRLALDPALLRTDEKNNPYSMPIGYKLLSHSYLNIGKPNECTLSVEKVLEFVEGIPTYEEVKATDRHYDRRIIAPMERDLNHLVEIGVLKWWDYCHEKGEPLTDAEQDERANAEAIGAPTPYDIAIHANIQWELAHTYDEQRAETVKARERRGKLKEAAKKRKADSKKRIERRKEGYIARKEAEKELAE